MLANLAAMTQRRPAHVTDRVVGLPLARDALGGGGRDGGISVVAMLYRLGTAFAVAATAATAATVSAVSVAGVLVVLVAGIGLTIAREEVGVLVAVKPRPAVELQHRGVRQACAT